MSFASNEGGSPFDFNPQSADNAAPQFSVLSQYVKDFSFENPNAPRSLTPSSQPQINVQINVNANPHNSTDFEVELKLEGRAEVDGSLMFSFDLLFCGMFRVRNVPQESVHPLVMIECPRLLFPFAREMVETAVRNGGFPPLLLDPVDFVGLYRQRMSQMQPANDPAPQL